MKRRMDQFVFSALLLVVTPTTVAWASEIAFDLTSPSLSTAPGGTVTFTGTVTNDSGVNLDASDFFFNFFGFDPASVAVIQDLGVENDFAIPNGSTSGLVSLFAVQLSLNPTGSSFLVDAQLEDSNSDLSPIRAVTLFVSGAVPSSVPEAESIWLTGGGLFAIAFLRRRSRYRRLFRDCLNLRSPALPMALVLVLWSGTGRVFAQSATEPAFSTQPEASGGVTSTYYVFLPLVNSGTGIATGVQVTSVTLGSVELTNTALPIVIGTMNPSDRSVLNLQFGAKSVVIGRSYLLVVRGTYKTGSSTLGFAVNRVITVKAASPTMQTVVEHWAAIDAANAKFGSLAGVDPKSDMEELLAFIRTLPQFVDSGMEPTLPSAWAQFADGEQIIFTDDMLPDAKVAKAQRNALQRELQGEPRSLLEEPVVTDNVSGRALAAAQPSSGTPVSSTAQFYSGLGEGYLLSDAMPHIASWSAARNYGSGAVLSPTVAALKTVSGAGVFLISTHAGFDSGMYSIWTSTKADEAEEAVDREHCTALDTGPPCDVIHDLDAGRLVYFNPYRSWTNYGITAAFVQQYWSFSRNSLVFILACSSDAPSPDAQAFKEATLRKGASVYAGWSGKVGDTYGATVGQFVFDRLLGANQDTDFTLTPPQRAFDYGSILTALKDYGLQFDPNPDNAGTTLRFTQNSNAAAGEFILLAPSISNMQMDEVRGKLTINGIFGTDPRQDGSSASVKVGGTSDMKNGLQVESGGLDVQIDSWDTNKIVVDLPLSGTGSAGNVQINARGHLSNVAQLTEWRGGKFVFSISLPGSLLAQTTYNVHLREDIRKYRDQIEIAPREPGPQALVAANDSTAKIVCTGVAPVPGNPPLTDTWTGSATLAPAESVPITTASFTFVGTVVSNTQMTLSGILNAAPLGVFAPGPEVCTYTMGTESLPLPVVGPQLLPGFGVGPVTGTTFQLTLDDATSDIHAGSPLSSSGFAYLGTPANARHSNYSFRWGAIPATPNTAPDPQSAR